MRTPSRRHEQPPGTHKRNRALSPLQRTKSLGPFSEGVASSRQPEEGRGGEWQVILHFQRTLPLLREANVAQVFFYWLLVSVSSLSRVHLEARKLFSGVYSFLRFFWERRVVVRQTG